MRQGQGKDSGALHYSAHLVMLACIVWSRQSNLHRDSDASVEVTIISGAWVTLSMLLHLLRCVAPVLSLRCVCIHDGADAGFAWAFLVQHQWEGCVRDGK